MPYIVFQWQDNSKVEDGHRVYRSSEPMNPNALPSPVATLGADVEEFVDETFTDESPLAEMLYYRVSSYKGSQNLVSEELSIENPGNVLHPDSPTWLFGGGESGYANTLALDTLFTDTSGTTPVEEYGDAIALATNLADDGPDMEQATGAERLVWGRMPNTGEYPQVRNLCARAGVPSDDFSVSGWGKSNGSISDEGDTIIDPETGQPVPAQRFTLSGGSSQHYISRGSFWASGESGGLVAWLVDVSGISNKTIVAFASQPNQRATFVWTGPQTITSNVDNASVERGFEIVGDYQALVWMRFTDARENAASTTLYAGAYGSYNGDGEYFSVARVQLEFAASPTAYQKVTAPYDVTQSGIPSVNIAYADPSDDNWSWDLAAGTYHLFVAGEKGCYFDTVTHAGGEFTVGPTTWTGGPAGAVTNLIGQRYVLAPEYRKDEPFTDFEKQQLVAYAKARGCPTLYTKSANLWTGENINVGSGWTDNGDGTYTSVGPGTGSPSIQQPIAEEEIPANALYIIDYTISRTAGSHRAEIIRPSIRAMTPDSTSSGRVYQVRAMTSPHSIDPNKLMIRNASGTLNGTVSNVGFYRIDAIPLN